MSGFVKLTSKQIDKKIDFIKDYTHADNPASGSKLDANANVTMKNLTSMSCELNKDINIQINRQILFNKISKLFDDEIANEYIRQLEDHEIYTHDETSLMPYCVAISMYPFLTDGMKKLGGEALAPKHLHSFCGSFVNLIFSVSCQFAGAVATVEFLTYFDYFARKDYGDDYLETHKQDIIDCLQQVVYCLNQPAGSRNYQSTFWNISLFDENYFNSLFGNFYFPDFTQPSYDSVRKLQNFFMKWFNDERTRAILTFPVVTAAMLVDEKGPKDKRFAKDCAKHLSEGNSFFIYESDSVDSLSSCCFSKDTEVKVKVDEKEMVITFGELAKLVEQSNKEILTMSDGKWSKCKLVVLPNRKMYKITLEDGNYLMVSDNHIHPTFFGDKRTDELTLDDSLIAYDEGDSLTTHYRQVKISSIEEVDYDGSIYCFEMENKEFPYFTLANGIVTHNCRLRNELADNDFSYSLGAGGVKSGSINVITMNVNKLIQETTNKICNEKEVSKQVLLETNRKYVYDKIYDAVREMVEKIQKYQVAYRSVMESYKAHGMLPVYDAGFIDLDKQFLTTGINGLVEGCEFLGLKISDNEEYKDFVSGLLKVIYDTDKAGKNRFGYKFNLEFVPAENLGVKNAKWDREAGLEVNRDCYNSYFYAVEDDSLNIIDKFRMHGKQFTRYLDGGSALHFALEEHPDAEQYYKMMCIASREGCNYWTTNIRGTYCESCGHIDKHTLDKCPACGSTSISYLTRVIGYLKKISNFSKERQKEASRRYYHKLGGLGL